MPPRRLFSLFDTPEDLVRELLTGRTVETDEDTFATFSLEAEDPESAREIQDAGLPELVRLEQRGREGPLRIPRLEKPVQFARYATDASVVCGWADDIPDSGGFIRSRFFLQRLS